MMRRRRKAIPKKPKGTSSERTNRTILSRTVILMIVCGIVLFIPLIAVLYNLMIVDHAMYEEMAIQNQTRNMVLTADRGVIYDRNMNIMASSSTVETIFLDPNAIALAEKEEEEKRLDGDEDYNPDRSAVYIAKGLSEILDVDAEFIREQAADTAYYYKIVKRKVPEETAQKVRSFINDHDLSGLVNLEMDSQRYYPYGSLAGQIVGFVRTDNVGAEGLEAYYDAALTGTAGAIITTKGNQNAEMLYTYEKYYDAADGNSLVLTLDVTVQYYLEKNLEEAMARYDVKNGAFGVIMDVNTGEIVAMATLGSYDPNNYQEVYDEALRQQLENQYQHALLMDEETQAYKDSMAAYNAAIAAARLGAKDILAIDIDPDAVTVAIENVELNGVKEHVRVVVGDLCKSEAIPCDLAVANIVADAICMLAGPLTRHLEKDKLLICSGIIREKEQQVMDAATEAGYTLFDRIEKGEWVALALKNEGK